MSKVQKINLKEKFEKEIIPELVKKTGNKLAVPRIEKIVVNIGIGRMTIGKTSQEIEKIQKTIINDLALITGQKPVLTKAKKSIAAFKLRQGMSIGIKVVLRGKRMYDFLGRIIHIALPRSRDFQGISEKKFDKKGNITFPIKEQIIFPEVSNSDFIFSFEITIRIKSKTKEQAIELLKLMDFPIK
ncbi:MAG: 50S ribosomal protein L5 [Candidatus Pacebacteria bacterium]|nr:50S ribosomal protein L5 [Candidatus Paceibacterota bacterium]